MGVELLRDHTRSNHAPYVKRKTNPWIATLLSMICPGLGAAYNGQTVKALVYFAIFVGLFQMAVLTSGTPLFVLGFIGMWFFAALDSWRTAQMIRSGVTPDSADDILVSRFSGNPKLWGAVLLVLGAAFLFQRVFNFVPVLRGVLPLMLIGLGIYVIKGYIFKPKSDDVRFTGSEPQTSFALTHSGIHESGYSDMSDRARSGSWRDI